MLVTTLGVILCIYLGLTVCMIAPFIARYLIVQYRARHKLWPTPQSSGVAGTSR